MLIKSCDENILEILSREIDKAYMLFQKRVYSYAYKDIIIVTSSKTKFLK